MSGGVEDPLNRERVRSLHMRGLLIVAGVQAPTTFTGTVYKPPFFEADRFIDKARQLRHEELSEFPAYTGDNPLSPHRFTWGEVLWRLPEEDLPKDIILALTDNYNQEQFLDGEMGSNIKALLSPAGVLSHGAIVAQEFASKPSFPEGLVVLGHIPVEHLRTGDYVFVDIKDETAELDVIRSVQA